MSFPRSTGFHISLKSLAGLGILVAIATALLVSSGCGMHGECTGDTPIPVLGSISPTSVNISVLPVTIEVRGSHFVTWSKVYINGAWAGSTYVSSSRLIATIDADTVDQGRITPGMTVPVRIDNVGTTVGAFAGSALGCSNGGLSGTVDLNIN